MPKGPTSRWQVHARLHMSIALLEAASRMELEFDDPDRILPVLAPAVSAIDTEVAELIADKDEVIAQLRAELATAKDETARAHHYAAVMEKFKQRAEDDAVSLGSCDLEGPFARPRGFFVYYLWSRTGEILYVGQSGLLFSRLGAHLCRKGLGPQISRVSYVQCRNGKEMRMLELRAIHKHSPPWNIADVIDRPAA